ncbi:UTP--glucose-1-phosphate uridylyltransferase [Teladorsagia circumcincta]|uniref:UTP--glucose-1-phosphate uridylyltransferase n=1 Tax=Teladorsagia circumcincta TaxID=45464 RepID=A0A2G9UWB4_TELCI|nr:UTP--glucose-1-phosphate uridylyltransferase [Teladorsagia circumcincta]
MNSFYTDQQTIEELGTSGDVRTFCQSRCPRIYEDTLLPVEEDGSDQEWYPPGHGNIFQSLEMTGVLHELLEQGRDIMLVSNIDNTGATLDLKIAQFACDEDVEFIMECTEKTENDIKVDDFHARFDDYPDMQDLDSLKVEGDVRFERDVVLKGDVTIVNKTTKRQVISAGTVLDNEQVVFE